MNNEICSEDKLEIDESTKSSKEPWLHSISMVFNYLAIKVPPIDEDEPSINAPFIAGFDTFDDAYEWVCSREKPFEHKLFDNANGNLYKFGLVERKEEEKNGN